MGEEGESQVGNWWRNCWLLVALILVSQGCCLDELASFSLSNLCLSLGVDKPGNPYTVCQFPPPSPALFSSQSLSFSSFISFLSYYCGRIPLSRFLSFFSLSIPLFRQSDIMQRAVDWKRAAWEGVVQPAGGQRWVCRRIGAGEGPNTDSVSLFQHTSQTNTSTTGLL